MILSSVAWVAVSERPKAIVVVENNNVESSVESESLTPLVCPKSNNGNCYYNKDGRVTVSSGER